MVTVTFDPLKFARFTRHTVRRLEKIICKALDIENEMKKEEIRQRIPGCKKGQCECHGTRR